MGDFQRDFLFFSEDWGNGSELFFFFFLFLFGSKFFLVVLLFLLVKVWFGVCF